jgi:hypothetical protein
VGLRSENKSLQQKDIYVGVKNNVLTSLSISTSSSYYSCEALSWIEE